MSSGFVFGGAPLKLTTSLIVPAVDASTVIVAGFAADAGCSGAGLDWLDPSGISAASKIIATKERIDIALIFSLCKKVVLGTRGYPHPLLRSPFLKGLHDSSPCIPI